MTKYSHLKSRRCIICIFTHVDFATSETPNIRFILRFQMLLSCASKITKGVLGRIGVFTVTSFHALVCARTPLTAATMYSGKNKKRGLLSTFKSDGQQKLRPRSPKPFSPQAR